jgi:hypothetical protein
MLVHIFGWWPGGELTSGIVELVFKFSRMTSRIYGLLPVFSHGGGGKGGEGEGGPNRTMARRMVAPGYGVLIHARTPGARIILHKTDFFVVRNILLRN